jgi:hypothetical protein
MKSAALILLAGVTLVPAISWDIEQVTFDQDAHHVAPQIALSDDGYARIVYGEVNEEQEEAYLKLAWQSSEEWVLKEMVGLSELFAYDFEEFLYYKNFTFDLDTSDVVYVAYFDFDVMEEEWITDLFLASADQDGLLDTTRLTEDTSFQFNPVIAVDESGEMNIGYQEFEYFESYAPYVYCGRFEDDSFYSMLVTKMVLQTDEVYPMDAALDEDGNPRFFFIGFNFSIWHAIPYETDSLLEWDIEKVSNSFAVCPSVVPEPSGAGTIFHVTYSSGEELDSICYCTNKTGEWETEYVGEGISYWWYYPMASPIALNYLAHPTIIWPGADGEIHCSEKTPLGWRQDILELPTDELLLSSGYYFDISEDGYGHLVYSAADTRDIYQIYYARTSEPLEIGIAEDPFSPPQNSPLSLEVRGSCVLFGLQGSASVTLDLYDASGRRIERIASGYYPTGEHIVPIRSCNLVAGVYFVRAEIGGQAASAKYVKTK